MDEITRQDVLDLFADSGWNLFGKWVDEVADAIADEVVEEYNEAGDGNLQKAEDQHTISLGQLVWGNEIDKDLAWYTEKGTEFIEADWYQHNRKAISYVVDAEDRLYMVIMNANCNNIKWKLPGFKKTYKWTMVLDSSEQFEFDKIASGSEIWVPAWSVLCFEIK
jgi:pullulanase/glycogen debranching enzyme